MTIRRRKTPLADMPWGDAFYEAVDTSIYKAVDQAITPLEDRLSRQIEQAFERLERQVAAPPQAPATSAQDTLGSPPPKRPRESGVDADAFERLQ